MTLSGNAVAAGVPHALFEYAGASEPNISFAVFDQGRRFLVPDPIKRHTTHADAALAGCTQEGR